MDVYYMQSTFGYDDARIEPQIIDPFSKEVLLPYSSKKQGLPNFIFTARTEDYFHKQYLMGMKLRVSTVASKFEQTRDMVCNPKNQRSEDMFKNERTRIIDLRGKTSEPAVYWWYRYFNLCQTSSYFIGWVKSFKGYINDC